MGEIPVIAFRHVGALVAPWFVGFCLAGVAFAQEAQDAASSRAAAFRAVEGPVEESVPGGTLMLAAYAVIWVLLFGYLYRLARLQSQNAKELARIESMVRRADAARPEGS